MTKNIYQEGELPTITEMKSFSSRFKTDEWDRLISNEVFVKNYDKDLNRLAIAAEMILAGRYVGSLKDVRTK
jgi:hypothetical protein